jgi:hypothetical protein
MSRLLQVVLAIVGLVLTAVLQNASNRNAEVQNAQGLVELYTQEISAALQTCNPSLLYVAQDHAVELDLLRDRGILRGETDFTDHVKAVRDTMACVAAGAAQTGGEPTTVAGASSPAADAAPVAPELIAQSRNLELRGMERQVEASASVSDVARAEVERSAAGERSFAVLASYAVSDPATFDESSGAAAHFAQLVAAAGGSGLDVQLYRTSVSNHFAIVIPADSPDAARDLVTRARTNGWAPDAFAQVERNWVRCPEPITSVTLRVCAGPAVNRRTEGNVARAPARSRD